MVGSSKHPTDPWVGRMLRLIVGGAFLAAGVLKIVDPAQFAFAISNYRLVPHEALHLMAVTLPWVEVVAGLAVLTGVWLRAGTLLICAMTIVFFVAITSALARGLNIECGCFGTVGGKNIGLQNLAIDTVLFALSAWLLWRTRGAQPDGAIAASAEPLPAE